MCRSVDFLIKETKHLLADISLVTDSFIGGTQMVLFLRLNGNCGKGNLRFGSALAGKNGSGR